jgi:hypothetical protein
MRAILRWCVAEEMGLCGTSAAPRQWPSDLALLKHARQLLLRCEAHGCASVAGAGCAGATCRRLFQTPFSTACSRRGSTASIHGGVPPAFMQSSCGARHPYRVFTRFPASESLLFAWPLRCRSGAIGAASPHGWKAKVTGSLPAQGRRAGFYFALTARGPFKGPRLGSAPISPQPTYLRHPCAGRGPAPLLFMLESQSHWVPASAGTTSEFLLRRDDEWFFRGARTSSSSFRRAGEASEYSVGMPRDEGTCFEKAKSLDPCLRRGDERQEATESQNRYKDAARGPSPGKLATWNGCNHSSGSTRGFQSNSPELPNSRTPLSPSPKPSSA